VLQLELDVLLELPERGDGAFVLEVVAELLLESADTRGEVRSGL
jgi:hypothetical protein